MFRTSRGLNRPAHMNSPQLPEYPVPGDLEAVLDVNDETPLNRKSLMYSKILESLTTAKYVDLAEDHYVQLLKFALYLEEYQSNEEMKKRKMFNQTIKKLSLRECKERGCSGEASVFAIHVKELEEERAWIRENDFVDAIDTKTYETYTLRVVKVEQSDVIGSDDASRLSKVFNPNNTYNINFRFQNYPLRCAHYALWLTSKENVIKYLFPYKHKSFIKMDNQDYEELTMFNPNIETNPEQKQAVVNILNKSAFPAPYILYGPPGTGKTATLVEAISQIHKASPSNRILVCTPSNTAADEVAKRLLKFVDACDMYRIYSQSKDRSTVDKELRSCCYCGGGSKTPLRREDIAGKAILISTLCTATRFALMQLSVNYFSHIIIDEAGQGTEPDMLIPISIASKDGQLCSQVVLAGDPQQLGPTVISKLADIILGRSILERLMSYDVYQKDYFNKYNPKYITKLLHNYRSHPSIIHISNKLFYENELVAKFADNDQKVSFPVIFHGVDGIEEKYSYSPSTYNYQEIRMVMKYVYDLLENKTEFGEVTAKDIGIVTPFKLQSKRIKKLLENKDREERNKLQQGTMTNVTILKKDDKRKQRSKKKKNNKENKRLANNEKNDEESPDDNSKEEKTKLENEKEENVLESEKEKDVLESENEEGVLENKKEKDELDSEKKENGVDGEKEKNDQELETKDSEVKKTKKEVQGKNNDVEKEKNLKRFKDINVGTVELFQGQERKIMIMTAVRSKTFLNNGKEHIGFLSNPKRFNVAMTRAQNGLIVIGNPGILQKDGMWHYLLKYCSENGSYRGLKFELKKSNSVKPILSGLQNIASTASLFHETPFKLFLLDALDSTSDLPSTVDAFVEPDKAEVESQELQELRQNLTKISLDEGYYF